MAVQLSLLKAYCDHFLKINQVNDWPSAKNGLQVEGPEIIRTVATAVDANLLTLEGAVACGADLLLVHHGLFWDDPRPWTGATFRKMRLCLENRLAVYSAHLPLDLHPVVGNNVLLARALGFRKMRPFFFEKGQWIGVRVEAKLLVSELLRRVEKATGQTPTLLAGGQNKVEKIGIVSGGAGNQLARAAEEGVEAFITGEGAHHTFGLAHDCGINVIYAGHYATETFGVRALGRRLAGKFGLKVVDLDVPSGL